MIRRTLFLASLMVLLLAGPASAQTYGEILGSGGTRQTSGNVASASRGGATSAGSGLGAGGSSSSQGSGNLPNTGSNDIVPMVQASIALIGAGALLVLVARRRSAGRRRALSA